MGQLSLAMSGFFFILLIFNNLFFLSQFPHNEVIAPWNFPMLSLLSFALMGFFLFIFLIEDSENFWRNFLLIAIFSSGIFALRFPILDEWLTSIALLAAIALVALKRLKPKENLKFSAWQIIFLVWLGHLLIASIVGAISYGNLKALRFTLLFAEVLALVFIFFTFKVKVPGANQFIKNIIWCANIYFLLVLAHWAVAKSLGMQPHILEGLGFAGTSYLAIASIVVIPAALFALFLKRDFDLKIGSLVSLILAFTIALLSDSRGAMLPLLISVGVLILLRPMNFLKFCAWGVVASIFISLIFYGHPHWLIDMMESFYAGLALKSGSMTFEYYGRTVTTAQGDAGRILYFWAGLTALFNEPLLLLQGAGNYGFFPIAGKYYASLADSLGVSSSIVNPGLSVAGVSEPPRPPALGAYIIETGLLGVLLLGACALATTANMLFYKKPAGTWGFRSSNLIFLSTLIALPLWTYFGEIQDIVFLYFLLCPGGILYILTRNEEAKSENLAH
ncbi:MAG: hypothetical protein COT74_11095 [Bdellovibrionales bacterium CG10_big_fil_rev_8_21_14_0_10_45_34]|nr:MAG: hypothetical protein COT74_11095 [Bdellovibrionales bacterium CG10_big_fil_rev_8_21_14_0_10_45_34]